MHLELPLVIFVCSHSPGKGPVHAGCSLHSNVRQRGKTTTKTVSHAFI